MPELTPPTREAARGIGMTVTALRKAERANRIAREPGGQWGIGIQPHPSLLARQEAGQRP